MMERYIQRIRDQIKEDLIIPTLYLTNSWETKNITRYSLYVKYPYPLFLMKPIYRMFRDAFLERDIDPDEKLKFQSKKKDRLEIKETKLNTIKGPIKDVKGHSVVARWKEHGFTVQVHPREIAISLYKNVELIEDPTSFVFNMLKKMNYPYYVIRFMVEIDKINSLIITIGKVEMKNALGWQIFL